MDRILDVTVSKGEMAMALLNTYSTIVVKTDLLTILFDPVKLNFYDEDKIDLIIITHEHSDHFERDLVIDLQKRNNTFVLTTPFLAQKLEELNENVKALEVGDSFQYKDISLHAEHSNHQANQPLSFVICNETAAIYHPNDSRFFAGMKAIRTNYHPDLMLYTGNLIGELQKIVAMIRPKIVVTYSDPRLTDMKIPGVAIKTLEPGEIFSYPHSTFEP